MKNLLTFGVATIEPSENLLLMAGNLEVDQFLI